MQISFHNPRFRHPLKKGREGNILVALNIFVILWLKVGFLSQSNINHDINQQLLSYCFHEKTIALDGSYIELCINGICRHAV